MSGCECGRREGGRPRTRTHARAREARRGEAPRWCIRSCCCRRTATNPRGTGGSSRASTGRLTVRREVGGRGASEVVCEALRSPRGSGGKGRGAHTPNNFTPPNPFKALPGAIAALGAGMPPLEDATRPREAQCDAGGVDSWREGREGRRGGTGLPGRGAAPAPPITPAAARRLLSRCSARVCRRVPASRAMRLFGGCWLARGARRRPLRRARRMSCC